MKILSLGAGQQSTALALMSAENAMKGESVHPQVPIYDLAVFCDLGCEPSWVYEQVEFVAQVYQDCGMRLVVLTSDIIEDHVQRIKNGKYIKIPLWTRDSKGKKGKLRRSCTLDYKIAAIRRYFRYEVLGYRYKEHTRMEDIGAHEMHIGFSAEEQDRIFASRHKMFVNKFPLAEMGLTRADNYRYTLEQWRRDTLGSSCYIYPFHKNFYFQYLKDNHHAEYQAVLEFDRALSEKPADHPIAAELFITSSLQRVSDLRSVDCQDAQTFSYNGREIWNGF